MRDHIWSRSRDSRGGGLLMLVTLPAHLELPLPLSWAFSRMTRSFFLSNFQKEWIMAQSSRSREGLAGANITTFRALYSSSLQSECRICQ